MGMVVEFPADAAQRRTGSSLERPGGMGTVLILPVIRIERHAEDFTGGDSENGSPSRRRRKRRARS